MTSTVAIVWPTILDVDAYAVAGRDVAIPRPDCPGCGQAMIFWPGYQRDVRVGTVRRIWVRRAKCVACAVTHALVPAFCLLGRLDAAGVIGSALLAGVEGTGMRTAAAALDLPHTTVRDWWRRFRARAPMIAAALSAVAVSLGVSVAGLSPDPPPCVRDRQRACGRAGVPIASAHRLRHSAATAMLRAGAPLAEIGQVLRQSRAATTAQYAKVDRVALRALAQPWPGAAA